MKNFLSPIILTILIIISAFSIWYFGKGKEFDDLIWIGSILAVFNCIAGWLAYSKESSIGYIYFIVGEMILILISLNVFWISSRVL